MSDDEGFVGNTYKLGLSPNYGSSPSDTSSYLGTSPPCRPHISEGSDLFKSVMGDIYSDSDSNENEKERSIFGYFKERSRLNDLAEAKNYKQKICDKCNLSTNVCKCEFEEMRKTQKRCDNMHHVHWCDEDSDAPLASEEPLPEPDHPKCDASKLRPILKHRVNCIIIISDS